MLKITRENEKFFTLEISGKLTAEAMEKGLDDLIEMTEDTEHGRLLYIITDFELPSLGAMMVEFRKLPALFSLIGKFEKAAVIADEAWIRSASQWEGAFLPKLDIMAFEPGEEAEARTWLNT